MIFSCNFKPDHSSLRTDTGNRRSRIAPQTRDVAFTYQRSAEKAETTAKSINSTGRRTVAIQADSADPKAITQSVSEAVSALGGLDILVSSAAISLNGLIADIDVDDYQMLMDVNVRASVLFAKAVTHPCAVYGREYDPASYLAVPLCARAIGYDSSRRI